MTPRALVLVTLGAANAAFAQRATITGQVLLKDANEPLGFATVSVVAQRRQMLANETGKFVMSVAPGEIRVRFKRIGFVPKDTTLTLAAGDTARLTIHLTRLAMQLPAMLVSGKCTNESPFQPQPEPLTTLFDQVHQNAERGMLLTEEKPFLLHVFRVNGYREGKKVVALERDTVIRGAIPAGPYVPGQVIRPGRGVDAGEWVMALPELPNFADTAFTNNHCFRYAGQTRLEADSVIKVDYEPVPWLEKEVDIKGTMYLRVSDYQLISTITSLNRIPGPFRASGLLDVVVRAKFTEFVPGIPVLDEWEMTRRYRSPIKPMVELGQVFRLQWMDTSAVIDTLSRRR